MNAVKQITSWSYSVYQDYVKCPHKVFLAKIKRVKMTEEVNDNLVYGNLVHGVAQKAVSGKHAMSKFPKEASKLMKFSGMLKNFRTRKAKTEQDWCFDIKWNPVRWNDWTHAWLRMKIDLFVDTAKPPVVDIIDWKTGKIYPEHAQQRSLYALGGLTLVKLGELAGGSDKVKLTASHVYVDQQMDSKEQFTMKNLEPLRREWLARTSEMFKDTKFKPKTGYHCNYCQYRKSNGGPCPENM